jgi:integrase
MKIIGSTIQQLDKLRKDGSEKPKSECRKWRLWVTTDQGRKSKRFEGTYTQAQKMLKEFVTELEGSVPNPDTFSAYAETWRLWREKTGGLSVGTLTNDRRNVNVLSSVLGDKRMDSITPEMVKKALVELKTGGKRELSGTYMNNLFTALNAIMQTAMDDGRIARNPCAKVKPPKTDTKEKDALSTAQMDALYAKVDTLARQGDGRAMAVLLMLDAGLRTGEALGLYVNDIDGSTVHVRRAMKERDGSIGDTKSASGVRDVPMTERLRASCEAYAAVRPDCATFCASTRGKPLRPQNFKRWWDKKSVDWGCAGFTPHQLRHSNLTKMARFMSPFDLQRWAGWSSIGPAKVYVHADQASLEAAVRRSQIGPVSNQISIVRTANAPEEEAGQSA